MSLFTKDPEAKLDYIWDWKALSNGVEGARSDWLAEGETITAYEITAPAGITVASHSQSNGRVTAWIEGGTVDTAYMVKCEITTSAERKDARSIEIRVKDR